MQDPKAEVQQYLEKSKIHELLEVPTSRANLVQISVSRGLQGNPCRTPLAVCSSCLAMYAVHIMHIRWRLPTY